jgi:predicted nucleic acid-binding protein
MLIVDTSVAVKWVIREEGSDSAVALIGRSLVAPDLFQAEVGNVLTRKVRRREIGPDQARLGFKEILAHVSMLPPADLAERAFELSLSLHHSIYDCYFLAAAVDRGWPMVTADESFIAKIRGDRRLPSIHLLGEEIEDV